MTATNQAIATADGGAVEQPKLQLSEMNSSEPSLATLPVKDEATPSADETVAKTEVTTDEEAAEESASTVVPTTGCGVVVDAEQNSSDMPTEVVEADADPASTEADPPSADVDEKTKSLDVPTEPSLEDPGSEADKPSAEVDENPDVPTESPQDDPAVCSEADTPCDAAEEQCSSPDVSSEVPPAETAVSAAADTPSDAVLEPTRASEAEIIAAEKEESSADAVTPATKEVTNEVVVEASDPVEECKQGEGIVEQVPSAAEASAEGAGEEKAAAVTQSHEGNSSSLDRPDVQPADQPTEENTADEPAVSTEETDAPTTCSPDKEEGDQKEAIAKDGNEVVQDLAHSSAAPSPAEEVAPETSNDEAAPAIALEDRDLGEQNPSEVVSEQSNETVLEETTPATSSASTEDAPASETHAVATPDVTPEARDDADNASAPIDGQDACGTEDVQEPQPVEPEETTTLAEAESQPAEPKATTPLAETESEREDVAAEATEVAAKGTENVVVSAEVASEPERTENSNPHAELVKADANEEHKTEVTVESTKSDAIEDPPTKKDTDAAMKDEKAVEDLEKNAPTLEGSAAASQAEVDTTPAPTVGHEKEADSDLAADVPNNDSDDIDGTQVVGESPPDVTESKAEVSGSPTLGSEDAVLTSETPEEAVATQHEPEEAVDTGKEKGTDEVVAEGVNEGTEDVEAKEEQAPVVEDAKREVSIPTATAGEETEANAGHDAPTPDSSCGIINEIEALKAEESKASEPTTENTKKVEAKTTEEKEDTVDSTPAPETKEAGTHTEPAPAHCTEKTKESPEKAPAEAEDSKAAALEQKSTVEAARTEIASIGAGKNDTEAPLAYGSIPATVTLEASKKETASLSTGAGDNVAHDVTTTQTDEDFSYEEEIVLEEYEEVEEYEVEYVEEEFLEEEIVEEEEESAEELTASSFTEVTYDSQDHVMEDVLESPTKRSQTKSAIQKKLEREEARKLAEAEEARLNMEFRLARQNSFAKKDDELKRRLAEEEARHIQEEEEREQQRIEAEERLAQIRAQEAATRIAQQQTEELRRLLEEEENRRKLAEAEARRLAAENAAREKAEADRKRREAEEAERMAREEKKRQMEEEVRMLQEKLAEAKRAADAARQKQLEEKKRLQAKAEPTKRKVKKVKKKSKDMNDSVQSLGTSHDVAATATPTPASPVRSPSPAAAQYASPAKPMTPGKLFKSPRRVSPEARAAPHIPKSPIRAAVSPIHPPEAPRTPVRSYSPAPPMVASPVKSVAPKSPQPPPPVSPAPPVAAPSAVGGGPYYSVEQLRKQSVPGLDYKNREIYLHPDDFMTVFGVDKAEFDTYPKWKKTNMKRKKKLF